MKHPGNARAFESTVRLLAERGHHVHLAFETVKTLDSLAVVQRLALESRLITYGLGPGAPRELPELRQALRASIDYLRYLDPGYGDAHKLRQRAATAAPGALVRVLGSPRASVISPRMISRLLRAVERRLPTARNFESYVRDQRPDVVLVTPLVGVASRQADALRAAARLGVPTVFPVHSWDNLTNKGLLRDVPDLTIVWNDHQAHEATELQGVPPQRVIAVGAPGFDHWFERRPLRTRAELLRDAGIDGDRPYLLYTCSSPFIAPEEIAFVREWVSRLRAAGGALAAAAVVVRPHPQNADQWVGARLDDPLTTVWPPLGEDPLDEQTRQNYFDSLALSSAVVGLNTSALVEAAIVERPVYTLLSKRFRDTQTGTLHFRYLADGHLHVAEEWPQHLEQLEAALETSGGDARSAGFARAFLRPLGVAATPRVVDAIEAVSEGSRLPSVRPSSSLARVLEPLDARLARRRRAVLPARLHQHPAIRDARRVLRNLAQRGGPIVVGPYRSEVGHELLYWIPFLRWVLDVEPVLAARLVAVSRGGVSDWYAGVTDQYLELSDLVAPEDLWRRTQATAGEVGGKRKQTVLGTLDRELLDVIAEQRQGDVGGVLHPSLLFDLMRALVRDPIRSADEPFRRERLAAPPTNLELPQRFTAVRFYASAAFPATDANRAFADGLLARLADAGDVVSLGSGGRHDEHTELVAADQIGRRVEGDAATNLAVQTSVVARASLLVGTYGGLSYLAPFVGVPAIGLYSERNFRVEHLAAIERLALKDSAFGSFHAFDARGLSRISALVSGMRPVRDSY
jgi:hypothetical protein